MRRDLRDLVPTNNPHVAAARVARHAAEAAAEVAAWLPDPMDAVHAARDVADLADMEAIVTIERPTNVGRTVRATVTVNGHTRTATRKVER